jgi:hypothetical protein
MGKKAAGDHTPLDDARWLPLTAAHQRWAARTFDDRLALNMLAEALGTARDGLPTMHLSTTGKRRRLKHTIWTERLTLRLDGNGLRVVLRPEPKDPFHIVRSFPGWFFVWQPAFERIWPIASPVEHDATTPPPGLKPKRNWPGLLAAWLVAVAVANPKRLENVDVLVEDATEFLQKKIGWAPADSKQIRKRIADLLQYVRN